MANTRVKDLTEAAELAATDNILIDNAAGTKRATIETLMEHIKTTLPVIVTVASEADLETTTAAEGTIAIVEEA